MKISHERILTTHVGSLPRSEKVFQSVFAREAGEKLDSHEYEKVIANAVRTVVEKQIEAALEQFERAVLARPEVMECYLMTGDADYYLRVVVEDLSAYERFLMDQLTRVQGIANIRSSFALKQVKYTTALPLESSALRG